MPSEITIYTDGASSGNPGPGGFGVVLISGKHRLEKSAGFRLTTNNRMELMAVIEGLEALKIPGSKGSCLHRLKICCRFRRKRMGIPMGIQSFQKEKNPDLWIRFLKIYRKHKVRFVWIKGHANNTENEICDKAGCGLPIQRALLEDFGYSPEDEDNNLL